MYLFHLNDDMQSKFAFTFRRNYFSETKATVVYRYPIVKDRLSENQSGLQTKTVENRNTNLKRTIEITTRLGRGHFMTKWWVKCGCIL